MMQNGWRMFHLVALHRLGMIGPEQAAAFERWRATRRLAIRGIIARGVR